MQDCNEIKTEKKQSKINLIANAKIINLQSHICEG